MRIGLFDKEEEMGDEKEMEMEMEIEIEMEMEMEKNDGCDQ